MIHTNDLELAFVYKICVNYHLRIIIKDVTRTFDHVDVIGYETNVVLNLETWVPRILQHEIARAFERTINFRHVRQ